MKFVSVAVVAAAVSLVGLPAAAQTIGNPSFETNFANPADDPWAAAGAGSVVYANVVSPAFGADYLPTDGQQFALLTAGPDDNYETLSQTFTLTKTSLVSFDAAFIARDEFDSDEQFNDDAFVSIGGQKLFVSDIATIGSFNSTPWTHVSVTLQAGTYTFEAGVENAGDVAAGGYEPGADSQLSLDNVQVAAAGVPEPQSWALMIVGFAGLGAAVRARRSASVL